MLGLWEVLYTEGIVYTMEHNFGIIIDKDNCVFLQVAEYSIAFPASKDADVIRVNVTKEQGHGAT